MIVTETEVRKAESRHRIAATLHRLLHSLRPFVRVYARTPEKQERMSDLDLVWVTGTEGSPEQTILDAIAAAPELWAHALPENCCIVPREPLEKLLGQDAANALAAHGASYVENYAQR